MFMIIFKGSKRDSSLNFEIKPPEEVVSTKSKKCQIEGSFLS